MVRSMYAGVAGMKANQTRMDVIGNNIANANTYGFKSSRATFRDMYYQQIRGASGGSATRGGTNPSMVGYGSQIASIDLLMTQSSFTSTGNPLDVAIAGEGFLQVMDPDGNIYYHFSDEEKLQRQYGYPDYENHKRYHEEYKRIVAGILNEFEQGGATVALVSKTNQAIAGWLLNHIKKEDVKVAAHIRSKRQD